MIFSMVVRFPIFPRIVRKILRETNPSKAHGLDDIPGLVLVECADQLAVPLTLIFRASLNTGVFPEKWKCAKVAPVFKKGDKKNLANYRPVALLSLLSKAFERYVCHHIVKHLESVNALSASQFGFRRGHQTLHPLLILHHASAQCLERSQELITAALDISEACDSVWQNRFLTAVLSVLMSDGGRCSKLSQRAKPSRFSRWIRLCS